MAAAPRRKVATIHTALASRGGCANATMTASSAVAATAAVGNQNSASSAEGILKPCIDHSLSGTFRSSSSSQTAACESDGARQSPRGESEPPEEIFGPFGKAERLNLLCSNKRVTNTRNQRLALTRSLAR